MSENALPKGYEPHAVEDHWREYWEKNKTFTPDPDAPGEPFSIVIPPPNVTGALHIGHALNHTLIDVLCRHARQKGKKVLWLPGTDHAGIATQNVVERALAKEGKTRHDLGREAFVERVWQWKEDYGNRILNQIRMLGDSVDWTRERFTMDEGLSKAVRKVFVELYKEGYIYKGKYIINWCSRCHTALADDEVDHMPEKGHLYHVRYDFEDGSGSVIIATTRPETIMADTGVCVHPEDERYAGLVGKKIVVPVIGRVVPLFADRYVDKEFGTGALKVTPCHDPNDWTLGERHDPETHLIPLILQAASGRRSEITIFGNDYDTPDGTCIRDYIHVADLADGHVKAVEIHQNDAGLHVYNLGTGQGSSVLEVLHAFEEAAAKTIPYAIAPRRDGDVPSYWADPSLAKAKLNWTAKRDLQQMMQDSWRWQSRNPNGYDD